MSWAFLMLLFSGFFSFVLVFWPLLHLVVSVVLWFFIGLLCLCGFVGFWRYLAAPSWGDFLGFLTFWVVLVSLFPFWGFGCWLALIVVVLCLLVEFWWLCCVSSWYFWMDNSLVFSIVGCLVVGGCWIISLVSRCWSFGWLWNTFIIMLIFIVMLIVSLSSLGALQVFGGSSYGLSDHCGWYQFCGLIIFPSLFWARAPMHRSMLLGEYVFLISIGLELLGFIFFALKFVTLLSNSGLEFSLSTLYFFLILTRSPLPRGFP